MSNYCKRIAKAKKKSGITIAKALMPSIEFMHSKGAKDIYINFDNNKHTLSIYTPDVSLSKEELLSKEMEESVNALAVLSTKKKSTISVTSK